LLSENPFLGNYQEVLDMGKKKRSFADKVSKGTGPRGEVCPKCETIKRVIKIVRAEKVDEKGSWRFVENVEKVCKCNEEELLAS
jgi:hypothetical protein